MSKVDMSSIEFRAALKCAQMNPIFHPIARAVEELRDENAELIRERIELRELLVGAKGFFLGGSEEIARLKELLKPYKRPEAIAAIEGVQQ